MTLFVAGYIAPTRDQCREWAVRKGFDVQHTIRTSSIDGRPFRHLYQADRTVSVEPLGNSYRVTVRAA